VDDRGATEYAIWSDVPCMKNCKDTVEITMRALVLDVTPDQVGFFTKEEVAGVEAEAEALTSEIEGPAVDLKLVTDGEKVFKKCKSCHQVGDRAKNKSGPILNGVVNRAAGSIEGFRYSRAMKAAAEGGLTWTGDELAAFLAKPKTYLKGTKMSFGGLRKEADQIAVIEYLKTFSR
jgi:cytochrome c2